MSNANSFDKLAYQQQAKDWTEFQLPTMPTVPAVQKFQDKVAGDLQALRNSVTEIAAVLRTERTELQAISGDSDSSPSKMARLSIEAKAKARDALTALMQGYEARLARVRQAAIDAQKEPSSPNEVVSELQLSTALGFVREMFAAAGAGNVGERELNTLMGLGLPGMATAVRTYIPQWIQMNYANAGTTLRQSVSRMLHSVLDKAAKPSEAPLYSAARDVLQELSEGEPRLKTAYQMAMTEAEGGIWVRSGTGRLAAWTKGTLIQVFAA